MEKKKNKWKVAFWLCFVLLILSTLFFVYNGIDRATLLDDLYSGYEWTDEDLNSVIKFINETDLSKSQIEGIIKKCSDFVEDKTIENDTIYLNRIKLIFSNNKLSEIKKYQ